MNIKLKELKVELKDLAKRIRSNKVMVKEYQRITNGRDGINGVLLRQMQYDFRHGHIAYCLYRGKNIKQIENKNKEHNEPNMSYVNRKLAVLKEGEVIIP